MAISLSSHHWYLWELIGYMYWWGLNDHKTEVPHIVRQGLNVFDLSKKSKFTKFLQGVLCETSLTLVVWKWNKMNCCYSRHCLSFPNINFASDDDSRFFSIFLNWNQWENTRRCKTCKIYREVLSAQSTKLWSWTEDIEQKLAVLTLSMHYNSN